MSGLPEKRRKLSDREWCASLVSQYGLDDWQAREDIVIQPDEDDNLKEPTLPGLNAETIIEDECMAQAAAIIPSIVSGLRQTKAISRGAKYLAPKMGKFAPAVRTIGDIAGALGFSKAIVNQNQKRKNRRKLGRRKSKKLGLVTIPDSRNTAGAANAPVAFARTEELRPYFAAYPADSEDGLLVHTVDFYGQTGTSSATASAWTVNTSQYVSPSNSTLFPWLSSLGSLFQRYKLKMLRLHYEHFCPTSVQGQIVLQYFPDPDFNGASLATLTQAQSQNCGNYMTGACYEDFCHEADLDGLDKSQWYNTQFTVTGDNDANFAGRAAVFQVNFPSSTPSTGNIWIETVMELNGRKSNAVTVGLSKFRSVMDSPAEKETKLRVGKAIVEKIVEDEEARKAKPIAKAGEEFLKDIIEEYLPLDKEKDRLTCLPTAQVKQSNLWTRA